MIIGEFAVQDLPNLSLDSTLTQAGKLLQASKSPIAAVLDHGRFVGALSEHDLAINACAAGLDPNSTAVSAVFDRQPMICAFDTALSEALNLMSRKQQSWLLVSDGERAATGYVRITALLDFIRARVPEESTGPEPDYVRQVRGEY